MTTRRTVLFSAAAAIAAAPARAGMSSSAVFPGKPTADTPTATVIKGTPTILDFGDGLKIPCDKSAFLTLWEGKTFWLTLGAGRSSYLLRAQGMAVLYALGAMKLLLMTLAFAPDRLVRENGGWRLKVQNTDNYVLGDFDLPGKPYWPINDTQFTGFGQSDAPTVTSPPAFGGAGVNPTDMLDQVDAYTSYIVLKKDADLDYVRAHAQLLVR